jgi:reverse gyrase
LLPENIEVEEEKVTSIVKDGWNLLVPLKVDPFPVEFKEGETYYLNVLSFIKRKVPKVFPYTQGELVEEMKKRGLGRPSTYAKIVQTLLDRRYVVEKGKFLYPTKLGIEVYTYLSSKFPEYTSEEFTRELESLMDKVESGEEDYQEILKRLKVVLQFTQLKPSQV